MIEFNGQVLFADWELRCRKTGIVQLAEGFAEELLELRVCLDQTMTVNSCCRSRDYNDEIDGHHRSLHVFDYPYWPTGGTCAIDISLHGRSRRYKIDLINLAWYMGWSIGIATTFIHLDRRSDYIPKDDPKNKQLRFYYG